MGMDYYYYYFFFYRIRFFGGWL